MQNTGFSTNKTLNLNGRLINLNPARIMGVLNVTPDSFFEGSRFTSPEDILRQAEKMITEGADIIDVGGYSSRPGAKDISSIEEAGRVVGVIRTLVRHFPHIPISVDTFRSEVAYQAVQEGASMINDISGGELDAEMFATVGKLRVPYVLMHMKGTPQTMNALAVYDDLIKELLTYFHKKISILRQLGLTDIIIDPGFGFAKTREQNFLLLNSLADLAITGLPLMVGLSRKSMVWKTLSIKPEEALNGSTALHAIALDRGAGILRVHDVKEAVEVVKLMTELRNTPSTTGR